MCSRNNSLYLTQAQLCLINPSYPYLLISFVPITTLNTYFVEFSRISQYFTLPLTSLYHLFFLFTLVTILVRLFSFGGEIYTKRNN